MWATWEEMDTREENLSPNPMTLDFRPVKPFLYPEPRCLISLQWSTCGNYLFFRRSLASACKNIRPQSWLSSVQESRDVLRLLSTGLTHNAGLPSWTLSRFMPFNLLLSLKIFLQSSGMSEIFPSNAHTPVSRLKSTKWKAANKCKNVTKQEPSFTRSRSDECESWCGWWVVAVLNKFIDRSKDLRYVDLVNSI